MPNLGLIKTRLSQYGVAWVLSFVLVLLGAAVATLLVRARLAIAADILLATALVALGALMAAFFVLTVIAKETPVTKTVLIALGLILLLPLLWAPILAMLAFARILNAPLEYSSVYAGFRVVVGQFLYGATRLLFGNPYVDAAWSFFQGAATVVGFLASLAQLWKAFRPRRPAAAQG